MGERDYQQEIGRRLRDVRRQQEMTLTQVADRSDGRFPAATVASWERANRSLNTSKLCELADFYGVPASSLLPDPTASQQPPPSDRFESAGCTVDLRHLHNLEGPGPRLVRSYADHVRHQRGDSSVTLTMRHSDLQALARLLGLTVTQLEASVAVNT